MSKKVASKLFYLVTHGLLEGYNYLSACDLETWLFASRKQATDFIKEELKLDYNPSRGLYHKAGTRSYEDLGAEIACIELSSYNKNKKKNREHLGDLLKGWNVMSLQNPTKKMSAKDTNINSVIYLDDDADTVYAKVKAAASDDEGCENLTEIYKACGGTHYKEVLNWDNPKHAKEKVADEISYKLKSLQVRLPQLLMLKVP